MKISVLIERDNKKKILEVDSVTEMFKKLDINSETVIVTRSNELITEDEELKDGDEIKLLSVISGG